MEPAGPVLPTSDSASRLRAVDFVSLVAIVAVVEWAGRAEMERLGVTNAFSVKAVKGVMVIRAAQLAAVLAPLSLIRRIPPSALGLRLGDWRRGLAWSAAVSAILLGGFGGAALGACLWDRTNLAAFAFGASPLAAADSWRARAALVTAMVFVGPVAEEVFFRGILYQWLRRGFSPLEANLPSALFFAAFHPVDFPLVQFVGGVAFALLYEKTGALFAPVLVHAAGNLAILLLPLCLS